ncbi:MAG TPA: hypothetical protein VEX86_01920 [Longimicrobium sp.]|nr:hypothetical protein [Longimicrobium sp.]
MHPDDAIHIAPNEPRAAHRTAGTNTRPALPRLIRRLLHAWMEGWTWYARQGFAPPAVEPVFPRRAAVRGEAAPRARRWSAPCPPPRFALLYGRGAGAGCP